MKILENIGKFPCVFVKQHYYIEYGRIITFRHQRKQYHERRNRKTFVIIDFGLSYEIKDLNRENYVQHGKKPFGVQVESYIPWPIEMNIMSYIARKVQDKTSAGYGAIQPEIWSNKMENASELKELCNIFLKTNDLLQDELFRERSAKIIWNVSINGWRQCVEKHGERCGI